MRRLEKDDMVAFVVENQSLFDDAMPWRLWRAATWAEEIKEKKARAP
jgi:hypothetical protein